MPERYIDGYYKQLLDDFKDAVLKHNTSIVIIIDGKSGKGKTTLSNQTGDYLSPTFNLGNIYYDPEEFLKGLATVKKGDFISFDEAMILSSRSAMSTINKMVIQAMSMIRSKNIFVTFCVNSFFDLDKNLVLSRADALLHVYGEGLTKRGRFAAFFQSSGDQFDRLKFLYLYGKKFYSYSKPRANFIGRFVKDFVVDEAAYEIEKQKFIDKFLTQEVKGKLRMSYDALIFKLVRFEGYKTKDIAKLAEVSMQTIRNILNKFENDPRNTSK